MNTLASLNPFFDSELAPAMGDPGSATVETNIPLSAVAANSVAPSLPAERAAIVAPESAPVSAAAVASIPPIGPRSLPTGPTTTAGDTGETIVSSPAAFSFQPDFEKLFNEIMGTRA